MRQAAETVYWRHIPTKNLDENYRSVSLKMSYRGGSYALVKAALFSHLAVAYRRHWHISPNLRPDAVVLYAL